MSIIIHADDFGLSRGITDNILHCIDKGVISSVSLIANGYAVDYAMDEYKKRHDVRLACHLNFFEGMPVSPADNVSLLVDKKGYFCHSFVSLWSKYLFSKKEDRKLLKQQIQLEMSAQIETLINKVEAEVPLNIDSHLHFHMIPFVFTSLLELRTKYNFSYIRMPDEPFFVHYENAKSIHNYLGANLIKHYMLNSLSKKYKKILTQIGIDYCDYFIGVLYTGKMSGGVVKSALSIIPVHEKQTTVEILFHPGGAYTGEEYLWANNEIISKPYFSPLRKFESKELTSDYLKNYLRQLSS